MGVMLITAALLAGIFITSTHLFLHLQDFKSVNRTSDPRPSLFNSLIRLPNSNKTNFDVASMTTTSLNDSPANQIENRQIKECSSDECIFLASNFKANINENVAPCDDFYEFACGNYKKRNPIPKSKNQVTELNKIRDYLQKQVRQLLKEPVNSEDNQQFALVKNYYASCIDEAKIEESGLDKIKEIISELGGWPVLDEDAEGRDWSEIIYGLKRVGIDPNYLMMFYVDNDYMNSSIRMLALSQPTFPLGRQSVILGQDSPNIGFYYNYMVKMSQLFGADEEIAKRDMQAALNFEISLAKISKSLAEILANITAAYNVLTIQELDETYPGFPWLEYVTNLTPESANINEKTKLIITEPKYVIEVVKLLQTTPKRVVANYLIWRFVYDTAKFLNKKVMRLKNAFIGSVLGKSEQSPRELDCVKNIEQKLGVILSSMYVRKFFDQKSRRIATDLVTNIKNEFRKILMDTSWLEDDKKNAVEKVDALVEHIAFPDELLDDAKLNSVFKDLQIPRDNYLIASLEIEKFKRNFKFERLHELVNKTDWIDNSLSATVNAFYKVETNSIILPAAILQGTFFNADRPKFANYGSIGFVIGHEITHGFDVVGHQFDKNGDLNNWWSETAEQDFETKRICLVEQFNKFTVQNQTVNGELTVSENIADYGGLKTSYLTYINWSKTNGPEGGLPGLAFNSNQLFWLSAANSWCSNIKPETERFNIIMDSHAPNKFRVNGPVMNLDMFAKDFQCPLGSKMNPVDKCMPW